jgi:hypothetical protein
MEKERNPTTHSQSKSGYDGLTLPGAGNKGKLTFLYSVKEN